MSLLQFPRPGGPQGPSVDPLLGRKFERLTDIGLRNVRDVLDELIAIRESVQPTLFATLTEPEPEPATAPGTADSFDVAASLSPSQLNCYCGDCQVKWYYRSVLKLPEASDTNRALGRAVHAAIGENFRQKIETKEDLPPEGVVAIYRDALAGELENVDGEITRETVDELVGVGTALIGVYMDQAAPSIEPAAIERRVEGEIGGVRVTGYIDLMDVAGNIIDYKTASKKPSGVRPDYRNQVTTYAMLEPRASGQVRLDTLTKTKTVQLHQQTIDIVDADRRMVERLYPLAQESMRAGIYTPSRGSFLCSRKYCAFWSRCCDEYGGEVD